MDVSIDGDTARIDGGIWLADDMINSGGGLIAHVLRAGCRRLLCDMSQLTRLDSIRIGILFGLARSCQEAGLRLAVHRLDPAFVQSLQWVNADRVMDILDEQDA